MKKYLLAGLFAAISATSVQAIENQKTVCSHGSQMRVIEVVYTAEGATPCEVRYSKEEGSKTLWSAANLEGYCEEKATAFIAKQQGWGWSCEASVNTVTTDEAEVAAEPIQQSDAESAVTTPATEAPTAAPATEASSQESTEESAPVAAVE
jgi:hypothetical protein